MIRLIINTKLLGSIKKHITSIIVFIINLALMGVGFLFIKNSDEAKKQQSMADDEQNMGDVSPDNAILDSVPVESPANESVVNSSTVVPSSDVANKNTSTNNKTSSATSTASPKSTVVNNSTNTTSSNTTATKSKSSSSKKSSAKTKTS